jgi:hypothetical protein
LLPACSRRETIQVYTIPKQPDVGQVAPPESSPTSVASGQRMLAAIVVNSGRAWFFKAVGPSEQMAGQAEPFRAFVRSLKFADDGDPTWTLPEGWRRLPGSGMRFATLQIGGGEKPVELTVIMLAMPPGDVSAYILSNVNRWRDQLGLRQITPEQLPASTSVIDVGDTRATLVDLEGKSASAGTRRPPFADHPPIGPKAGDQRMGPPPGAGSGGGLVYETPAGWEPIGAGGMRKAAFVVRDGDAQVEIIVIDLPGDAGDTVGTVNLWRQQVGLEPISEGELAEETREIDFAGVAGKLVEFVAPETAEPREAILGVMAVVGDRSWFVKLKGDAEVAARERERFEAFVRSIRFAGGEEEKS